MEKFILLTGHDGNKVIVNTDHILAVCTERKGNNVFSCIIIDKKENSNHSPTAFLVREDVATIYHTIIIKENP